MLNRDRSSSLDVHADNGRLRVHPRVRYEVRLPKHPVIQRLYVCNRGAILTLLVRALDLVGL